RERFGHDALIDLVGYRRHGHNEADEPGYTQPLMYERIKNHPSAREQYAKKLVAEGILTAEEADRKFDAAYQQLVESQQGFKASLASPKPAERAPAKLVRGEDPDTSVPADTLTALN